MLGWLVEEEGIEPYVPVIDNSRRNDGTFSREDLAYDPQKDAYTCPGGKRDAPIPVSRRASLLPTFA